MTSVNNKQMKWLKRQVAYHNLRSLTSVVIWIKIDKIMEPYADLTESVFRRGSECHDAFYGGDIVKKKWMLKGAAFCAAMLFAGGMAAAEERRLGDYIYVPAMQVAPVSGTISLRVEGLALTDESDEPVVQQMLAGAEFGVYVFSSAGELTPWANPLYPSEPMRIRSQAGEARFSLPQGAEYYLRQESAPQGYSFDDEALIPVTGEEIVVQNYMAGQLLVSAVDSLGAPVSGVEILIEDGKGVQHTLLTDDHGEAVICSVSEEEYLIREGTLPEGVFPAQRVLGSQETAEGMYACVEPARRTRVVFEHPAPGSVLLDMRLNVLGDDGQMVSEPLAGVRLDILAEPVVSVTTDAQGQARTQVMEGTYNVRLSIEGNDDVILPLSEGQMIVSSGSTTVIELSAAQKTGRIALSASAEKAFEGGSFSLIREENAKVYGPYSLDGEGFAVSEPLEPGVYRVTALEFAEGVQFGSITSEGMSAVQAEDIALEVHAGELTQVNVDLLTREKQMFGVVLESIDENGEVVQNPVAQSLALTLVDNQGNGVAQLESMLGIVTVEGLSGEYRLRMSDTDAQRHGVLPLCAPFRLPSEQDTIRFQSENTRILLSSVNELGEVVAGAVYQLTDSIGNRFEVVCDDDGMAVTPLMTAGEVKIVTLDAPSGHAPAAEMKMEAKAGEAARVQIMHERFGTAEIQVLVRSLDDNGGAVYSPVQGTPVRLYHAAEDGSTTDTGITLISDEEGKIRVSLEEGEYAAEADETSLGMTAGDPVRFSVRNTQETTAQLICMDALGGVQVCLTGDKLTDDQMAQTRFEIVDADGSATQLHVYEGLFYAGGLTAGEYTLRQTQIPQGYTLCKDQKVIISGGEAALVHVPLEEYAVLDVSKTGLTFDQQMRTYVVPLSGEYGVYVMDGEELKPYPSQEEQATVWANVTHEEIALGKMGNVKLPASVEGTVYYLREITRAPGFAADENTYEVVLRAGERATLSCAVSSDRGFFMFDLVDAVSGEHVPGGMFELVDNRSGDVVLSFELGDMPYQNPMAVPVGSYRLRQRQAAPGYALSVPAEIDVSVDPYLSEGGKVTEAAMMACAVPDSNEMDLFRDIYSASEQGLSLLCVEMAASPEALHAPVLTIEVGAAGSERSDISSVVIAGTGDAAGGSYRARVEYCLDGGGWQPSDARMTDAISGPVAVSLADVHDDISAVRITYVDAATGMEYAGSGFMPGQVSLSLEASAQGDLNMLADAQFTGQYVYQTELEGARQILERSASAQHAFTMHASSLFETVSAGRDGRITGLAFFDEDADGVMDAHETGRYAGLTVSLQTLSGEVVDSVRTASDGSYAFNAISGGEYVVQFDAGESVVFSKGSIYSEHAVSGIEDLRYGRSRTLTVDGDHTDYVVHVGCIFGSEIFGSIVERTEGEQLAGFAGLNIELRAVDADEDEEPIVVVTGGMGEFSFGRLLPGRYEIALEIPQGYLCRDAAAGSIVREIELQSGETHEFGLLQMEKEAAVYGTVRVDEDGDGEIDENAAVLTGVRVILLNADGAHTEQVLETTTDEQGAYAFTGLYPGNYSVLFELDGNWAFTRFGADSLVYGAVSQSGATQAFILEPGQIYSGVDAGVTMPSRLTVSVFEDTQYDGQKGVYEKMLSGVQISLIRRENGQDAEEMTYVTPDNGAVVFEGVSPGEYVLAYELPGFWRSTKQVTSEHYPVSCVPQSSERFGRSEPFALDMNNPDKQLYIGAMLSGAVSGVVYYDDDDDARRDEGETPCTDVLVELLSGGNVMMSAEPDEQGSYLFDGLAPGRYTVRFTAKEGCGFSGTERTAARNGVQASDSHVSATRLIAVSGGQTVSGADAGVVRLSSVSGMIWEDQNGDQKMDHDEQSMHGLSIHLMDGAGRNILRTVETDENGSFVFDHLKPATYKIRVDAPKGYVFSGALADGKLPLEEQRDGRGYSAPFALLGGVQADGIGYGLLTQGTIGGFVWEDTDADGYMGADEPGLRGIAIDLLDDLGQTVATRQTMRSGEFVFDQLMPGDYSLRVTLDEEYAFTAGGAESVAPHGAAGSVDIPVGTLTMGGSIMDVRIGAVKTAAIGGVVWLDADDDGRRQPDDQGMRGVRATLTMTEGMDAGRIYETTADEFGVYRFEGLTPGKAQITFELADGYAFAKRVSGTRRVSSVDKLDMLTAATDIFDVVGGELRTDLDVGVVPVGTVSGRIWEDTRYDGQMDDDEPGVAGAVIELIDAATGKTIHEAVSDENGMYSIAFARKGEYRARITLADGQIFTRSGDSAIDGVDAAQAMTAQFTLGMGESRNSLHIGAIVPAVASGRVVIDENEDGVCGIDEQGLEGAAITAMQGGTAVATAYANEAGEFVFDTLRPGIYRLRYALENDVLFALDHHLNVTHADAPEAETGEFELTMGQHFAAYDVPVVLASKIAGKAWVDENVSGIMDAHEGHLGGVGVELIDSHGLVIAQTETESDGSYAFERLRSGMYALRFALGEDMLFTDYTGIPGGSCVPQLAGGEGESAPFGLGMGEQKDQMHVGAIEPGRIGDTVWHDKDGNGLQDYKEPLIPGVSMTLLYVHADGTMTETQTLESDRFGYYAFESLRPGTYVIRVNMQAGDSLTSVFGAPLGEIDSDIDPETGMSAPFTLQSGQMLRNIDVGFTEHRD